MVVSKGKNILTDAVLIVLPKNRYGFTQRFLYVVCLLYEIIIAWSPWNFTRSVVKLPDEWLASQEKIM